MPIVLVRIDDRLVHGQIVQGWLKILDVNIILVVSDIVTLDTMQQMLMTMAVPDNIKLDIKNLKNATNGITNGQYDKERVMILAVSPSDILYMIEAGADFKSVNVGGMHFISGKRQLLRNLCVNDNDVESLHKIHIKSVEIEGRILPEDEKKDIIPLIEKEYRSMHSR
ncbi:PTS system mannose/fructose/N-acetylgalactosamine-transporter subunit IIB [Candidatus Endomicrobiellum trichonymphae]|uniref:PTS mannose/fructose/N-acetylgalactosamine-specific component IIB n=1 Tax=Endomicrobium trichonymphae TaxID=1408204 RepID=B1H086_ENDTX|nr:PTS sugar transporter subunit IIB [Candidatus Endomicrobium trichonymphae]BAG13918.1 PTS mannose/fructose/N-acetylgalactosamine-specific component IIB [Candidatus Endomicrobium trichonymphae]